MSDETTMIGDAAPPPRLRIEQHGRVSVVTFPRRKIDGVAVRELYEAAAELSNASGARILLDFTGVPIVSSGVLGIVVAINRHLRHQGGRLHLLVPEETARIQFEAANLHHLLRIFTDRDEAISAFK